MSIQEYWNNLKKHLLTSWTMRSVYFFTLVGLVEANFHLLRPYLGEERWGLYYFAVLVVVGAARVKGLHEQAKRP